MEDAGRYQYPPDGRNSPASPVCSSVIDEDEFAASMEAALNTPKGHLDHVGVEDGLRAFDDDPARTPRSDSASISRMSSEGSLQPDSYFVTKSIHTGQPPAPAASASKDSSASSSANVSSTSIAALHSNVQGISRPPSVSIASAESPAVPTDSASGPTTTITPESTSSHDRHGYPIYPNQSFSVLHSQVYPPPHLPPLRSRNSHPSQHPAVAAARNRSAESSVMDLGSRTTGHTPVSSPGLFAPMTPTSSPAISSDDGSYSSPFLHWTQKQRPKETHVADKDIDPISGRKLLNQYEIIDELGRGVHGKVKLGRNLEKGFEVAIKIVARYSKRRRLGKLGNPEDKVKKEVAILKKAIHPNVVTLLEVIDDPAIMKVYIVLEYVELGEIVWRVKGVKEIAAIERRRIERESRGVIDEAALIEDERLLTEMQARGAEHKGHSAESPLSHLGRADYWSLEHGGTSADGDNPSLPSGSLVSSIHSSSGKALNVQVTSSKESSAAGKGPDRLEHTQSQDERAANEETESEPLSTDSSHAALCDLEGHPFGAQKYNLSQGLGSHMADIFGTIPSNLDYDAYEEDFSYVPCLTIEQARRTFRDTVLGLEYLHYQGIIHRDIKPANLLWTAEHRVKISDFGVSYLGRPIRDDDDNNEDLAEADAQPLDEAVELAKTVGTPAFYAPELCYTDLTAPRLAVTGQIDLWALGVTLYCLVFARLPFLAEDEYSLFKSISEDAVFIPTRRLKAVDPRPSARSASNPPLSSPPGGDFRLEADLVYEDVDGDLLDLLKRILVKDPTKRISLKEVKRHPFVLHGISDPIRWIDGTDPGRQNEGRRIEVSHEDMEKAVVSIGFLERVRSGMRKVGQAIGFGKAREGRKRVRGNASATEDSSDSVSPTPTLRESRRSSPRDDDPSFTVRTAREGEHPLAQSVTASPDISDASPFFQDLGIRSASPGSPPRSAPGADASAPIARPSAPERPMSTSAASLDTVIPYDSTATPLRSPGLLGATAVESLGSSNLGGIFGGSGGRQAKNEPTGDAVGAGGASSENKSPPMDRVALGADDPHAEPSRALSNAVVAGHVDRPSPSRETFPSGPFGHASPTSAQSSSGLTSPQLLKTFLAGSVENKAVEPPTTSSGRPISAPDAKRRVSIREDAGVGRPWSTHESTSDSFARAQEQNFRRRRLEFEASQGRPASAAEARAPAPKETCPPSPDDEIFHRRQPEKDARRRERARPNTTSDLILSNASSPSNLPMMSSSSEDHMTSGMSQSTSYPSVPSVVSAGSSIATDDAAAYLAKKETVSPMPRTEDTMTPPRQKPRQSTATIGSDEDAGYNGDHGGDDEEDSDDDDFLVMSRHKAGVDGANKNGSTHGSIRRGSSKATRSTRSGSTGTLRKTLSHEESEQDRATNQSNA